MHSSNSNHLIAQVDEHIINFRCRTSTAGFFFENLVRPARSSFGGSTLPLAPMVMVHAPSSCDFLCRLQDHRTVLDISQNLFIA